MGHGGYDIFKSVWQDTVWSDPINMGYPINSTYDDIFFVISEAARTASPLAGFAHEADSSLFYHFITLHAWEKTHSRLVF